MSHTQTKTHQLFNKAKQYIPYGVNSNFRYWGEEDTPIMARGAGAYVWDVDDNRFIDYRLGFGPIILGHAHPEVNRRVAAAIQDGVLSVSYTHLVYGIFITLLTPGFTLWFARDEEIRSGLQLSEIFEWTRTHATDVILYMLASVSYTHLDVYKRQAAPLTVRCPTTPPSALTGSQICSMASPPCAATATTAICCSRPTTPGATAAWARWWCG